MAVRTPVCELLGIDQPIVQAPMSAVVPLAAAVSNAGIELELRGVTHDGVRYAVEFNLVRWGPHGVPKQAGMAVFERDPGRLLFAVRMYEDVEAPVDAPEPDHEEVPT